jgi:hypothetical protein
MDMVLREITLLREQVEKRIEGHEGRLQIIERVHAEQRGAWGMLVGLVTLAGAFGGLIGSAIRWMVTSM